MAVKAYILITVETASTRDVIERLRQVGRLTAVTEVLGPYDVVAEMEEADVDDVTWVLRREIRPIPGIRETVTCIGLRQTWEGPAAEAP